MKKRPELENFNFGSKTTIKFAVFDDSLNYTFGYLRYDERLLRKRITVVLKLLFTQFCQSFLCIKPNRF